MQTTIHNLKQEDLQFIQKIFTLYWPEEDLRERFMQRLIGVVNKDPEIARSNFVCLVAEENNEAVGLIGFRTAPEHMRNYATTDTTAEIYILAAKIKGQGTGRALVEKSLETLRASGYNEVVLYSGETHKDSYGFYEHMKFENAGPMSAPNGEVGVVWKMVL